MDTLRIETGEKRIAIEKEDGTPDPERVIVFNPSDVVFAERFEGLRFKAIAKVREFETQAKNIERTTGESEDIAKEKENHVNVLRRELCEYMRGIIDELFGKDTSQKAFGDLMSEIAIISFLDGIAPYIQTVRAEKVAKYTSAATAKKNKRKR